MRDLLTRATVNDIAKAAGVTKGEAAKALRRAKDVDPSTRARVDAALAEIVYRPLAPARDGGPFTIGLEVPSARNPFFDTIVAGAMAAIAGGPHQLIVAPGDHMGARAIDTLVDRRADGIVAVCPLLSPQAVETLAARVPLVMLGRHNRSPLYDTVMSDDEAGAAAVMEHLLERGHRRIAHVTHEDFLTQRDSGTPHSIRLATYESVMRIENLQKSARVLRCRAGEDSAYAITRDVLSGPDRPTAFFAAHDELALGVLRAVREAGHGVAGAAVVGYDNTTLSGHPFVSLTSVDQGGPEMARVAVELLLERLAGRTEPRRVTTTSHLIVRGSSSPPLKRR